jgi:D-beta-D-heptose 7-phosphate kinase/D-beta-D-heptose 1-phosphate adenosyltransferase
MYEFTKTKILVVGDVMLDQYWSGSAKRISPEAPVPVVKITANELRAGGAANVALNISSLGAEVTLLGVVGKDDFANKLTSLLAKAKVKTKWVVSDSGTICKLRVLSHHQQLIRMDFEQPVAKQAATEIASLTADLVKDFDALVIPDYAKGSLQAIADIIKSAKQHNVPVFIDPKGLDFSCYAGAYLIKPNQTEFEQIVGVCTDESQIITKAKQLIKKLNIQAMLITRSENGMLLIEKDKEPFLLSSKAQEVFDVTGAGDTVMATLATVFASGHNLKNAVHCANEAASIVVKKVGTSTVTKAELEQQLKDDSRHQGYSSMSVDKVKILVKIAQEKGEKVVITNGCFDILHSGHVRYLNEAAKQGDRLIVAVNSDESVKKLKGDSRPIVNLSSRMELLSALSCVDWVVPFDEETPENLICNLLADVLVKGGDYKPEQIAGSKCVWDNGGEVKILSFWDGYSTTNLVKKIKEAKNGY